MNDELERMRKEKARSSLDVDLIFEILHEGTEENNDNIQRADYERRFKF
jgi:hypothetical protein